MKILIFAEVYYPDIFGGGEFSTKQMAEGLVSKGHNVVVYCLGKKEVTEDINGVSVKRKYLLGLSEHFLSNTKNNTVTDPYTKLDKIAKKYGDLYYNSKWYERYRTIISKEKPDVVHTVSPMTYLGRYNLWRAGYDLKIPVSHVSRGPNLLELKFMGGMLDRYNIRRNAKASFYLTAFASPSRYMLDSHNRVGIKGQRFNEVIYNSVDFETVSVSEALIEKKDNIVLYAGEIREEKGIKDLVRAMDGIKDAQLVVIGRGKLTDWVKSVKNVEVIDWMEREALYSYMRNSKVVVLPSRWNEPFGRVLIEAINNGTIAIGSKRGGIPEVLDNNEDYIFESGNIDALRRRIEWVINMPADTYLKEVTKLQKKMTTFNNDNYIDNWERFFLKQL